MDQYRKFQFQLQLQPPIIQLAVSILSSLNVFWSRNIFFYLILGFGLIFDKFKLKLWQAGSEVGAAGSDRPFADKVLDLKDAFWRFLRPHTIRGTALGSA